MNFFTETILNWYEQNARQLPWRETQNPYLIWISEIILQQTRVNQGYDYYCRFIRRFPDIQSLAEADEDEVLRYWQGLGYYSRARNLHEAAKSMKGTFPDTYEGVLSLKGVGTYTAAAICSMAYNQPYAVIDGNVYRVLSRYLGIDTPIDSSAGKKIFAETAQTLLYTKQPGKYNQAIMDFGAMQCTPLSPRCLFCPLSEQCDAFRHGNVQLLPVKQHRTQVTDRYFHYIYVHDKEYIWLHKREGKDIWEGLYELPLVETERPLNDPTDLLHLLEKQWMHEKGNMPSFTLVETKKHVLTHRIIHASFYEMDLNSIPLPPNFIRIKREHWTDYPMPQLIHLFLEKHG